MPMRYLSVCSGIEAASVAWHQLGWEPVAFSEVEPFPCAVLAHYYPNVPNLGDMTKIDGSKYHETVELVVGGTPCQDFSVAGKRAGMAGERGALALSYLDLLEQIRPRWVVWENVTGVLSTNGGRDFGSFLWGLAKLRYGFAYRILDAQHFGVPQRRRRVFVVGYRGDWRPAAAVLFEPHSLRGHSAPSRKAQKNIAGAITAGAYTGGAEGRPGGIAVYHFVPHITQALTGSLGAGGADDNRAQAGFYVPEIVSQAMSCKWAKGTSGPAGDEHHNLIAFHGSQDPDVSGNVTHPLGQNQGQEVCIAMTPEMRVRRLTPKECERLQGFPDNYTDIPYRGKPATDRPRYKALGNSMAVPVMRWIGARIEAVENSPPAQCNKE